jgi:hypothetical protein
MRKDITVLGKFSLNLTNVPVTTPASPEDKRNFSTCFYTALKQFVPTSHLFALTIDSLNKSNIIPNKDYNKNKLVTGMLQLPDHFNLVIDETCLSTGELNQKGSNKLFFFNGLIFQKLYKNVYIKSNFRSPKLQQSE